MEFSAAIVAMAGSIGSAVARNPLSQLSVLLMGLSTAAYGTWTILRRGREKRQRAATEQVQRENVLSGSPIEPKHATPKLKKIGRGINKSLRHFFSDFDQFGMIANDWPPSRIARGESKNSGKRSCKPSVMSRPATVIVMICSTIDSK